MSINLRQSYRLKFCLWIFGASILAFSIIFGVCIYFVRDEVKKESLAIANSKLDYVLRSLDEGLATTETAANNLAGIYQSPFIKQNTDSIISLCKFFLHDNPQVQGVAFGFEPGVFKDRAHSTKCRDGFAPYVMRVDTGYIIHDLAQIKDYRNSDWYKIPLTTGKPYWFDSFVEINGTMITSYCIPIRREGKIVGVFAVDLGIEGISDSIQKLRPYPTATLAIIDRQGRYIAHPNPDYIMKESLESVFKKLKTPPHPDVLSKIKAHERGVDFYYGSKDRIVLYYAPEPKTGCMVTLEVPRKDLAKGFDEMFKTLFLAMIIGIILLIFASWVIITRLTRPLEKFAKAARHISHGNFDVQLPVFKEHNELYDLRQALASMEMSLNQYIKELKKTAESKAAMESELKIARNIQMSMVPKIFPPYPERHDIDIYASLTPAKAVGGDLYDFYLDGDDLYFCIGDVSGKGVPASLFMAITRSLFRNVVMHENTPANIAKTLNYALAQGNDEGMFVTMMIGKGNLVTGSFTCCNCGHNAPVTNGELDQKTMHVSPSKDAHYISTLPTNIPVGVLEDYDYQEVTMTVEEGVAVFLYTDGVTEAENKDEMLYGEDRLLECIKNCGHGASSNTLIKVVLDDVHRYALGAEQSDDITMLCLKYLGKQSDNEN